jgi:hypothetical protein
MSTPSPAGRISLPAGKRYQVTILNEEHYPSGHPAQLVFSEDKAKKSWIASFSVPNVLLTELDSNVKVLEDGQYEFRFTLNNPTLDQKNAGYIKGAYIFKFHPPGPDPAGFGGRVNDPWKKPDETEDNWTAEGRPPESGEGGTYS